MKTMNVFPRACLESDKEYRIVSILPPIEHDFNINTIVLLLPNIIDRL